MNAKRLVLERLSPSVQRPADDAKLERYCSGHATGRGWALACLADAEESLKLRRLGELRDHLSGQRWQEFFTVSARAATVLEKILSKIDPELLDDLAALDAFLDSLFSADSASQQDDPAFVRGFAEGALDVWESAPH